MLIRILASFKRKPYVSQTPSLKGYVKVFNKTTGETQQLQPQRHSLIESLQAQFDIACALQAQRMATIAIRPKFN